MELFTLEMFENEDAEAGIFISDLGRALVTWTAMQNCREVTVTEAAKVFNTTPEIVRTAIDGASWITYSDEVIELDGE